jgi:hypothetical protein
MFSLFTLQSCLYQRHKSFTSIFLIPRLILSVNNVQQLLFKRSSVMNFSEAVLIIARNFVVIFRYSDLAIIITFRKV